MDEQRQPMPSMAERVEVQGTVTGRLNEIRKSIGELEQELLEAKGAADVTTEEEKREQQLDHIDEIEEAIEHLREEERELVASETEEVSGEEDVAA